MYKVDILGYRERMLICSKMFSYFKWIGLYPLFPCLSCYLYISSHHLLTASKSMEIVCLNQGLWFTNKVVKGAISGAGLADSGPDPGRTPSPRQHSALPLRTESVMDQVPSQLWGLSWV